LAPHDRIDSVKVIVSEFEKLLELSSVILRSLVLGDGVSLRPDNLSIDAINAWRQMLVLPAVAQTCRDSIDGQLDSTQEHRVVRVLPILLEQLDLEMVQRIQIRKAVSNRTR